MAAGSVGQRGKSAENCGFLASHFTRLQRLAQPHSPGDRGGGWATARAALPEGKRMDKILTLLILLLQVFKLLLEYLNR